MRDIMKAIRDRYGAIGATGQMGCCGPESGCGPMPGGASALAAAMGYSEADTRSAPTGSNLGLGCGNPLAIASLRPGEVVLDLGSGGGFDCFLAAERVGPSGRVIGVDMTPEMLARSRQNATRAGASNVEFRLGEIEHLPLADASVDVVISNCVVNLSGDKPAVFREAWRVLKPGGRLAIMDMVALGPLPDEIRRNLELYTACVAGTETVAVLEAALQAAGFAEVEIQVNEASRELIRSHLPGLEAHVASASITAWKRA